MHITYTVQLSVDLFCGLQIIMTGEEIYGLSLQEQEALITLKAKSKLKSIFSTHNLELLSDKVNLLNVHLHGKLKENVINYACDHKHVL